MRRLVLGLVVVMSGCNYEAPSEITCVAADVRAGYTCVGGYWVSTGVADVGLTDLASDQSVDTSPDLACARPTAAEFCASLTKNCGTVSGTDACGEERTEECGICTAPDTCQADNTCTCSPEDELAFCDRLGKDCDDTTALDNCGVTRTVNCGSCETGQCGDDAPNVCGCPCLINGACVAEDSRNPTNQCEVCDSAASATGWTLGTGLSCNDQDKCTTTDVCDAVGICAGAAKDCSALGEICKTGQCDSANGNCVALNKPEQAACTDDGLACTADVCVAGACENSVLPATCLIAGTCVAANATNGTNVCEKCAPATSKTTWSVNNGASCDDGIACTTDDICSNRTCAGSLMGCYVTGTCVAEGAAANPTSCLVCDSSENSTAYTAKSVGSACPVNDGLACTSQSCAADGSCSTVIFATNCVINGACVSLLATNPSNACQICNPQVSQTMWSNQVENLTCPGPTGCKCMSGSCEKNGNSCS